MTLGVVLNRAAGRKLRHKPGHTIVVAVFSRSICLLKKAKRETQFAIAECL